MQILLLFLCASLFYVQPHYIGQPFMRIWIPVVVFMTGGVAYGIWIVLMRTIHRATNIPLIHQPNQLFAIDHPKLAPVASIKLLTVILVVLVLCIVQFVNHHAFYLVDQIRYRVNHQNFVLYPEQPGLLTSQAAVGDKVLYLDEAFRDFYLTHGALEYGAIYYPVLAGTSEEDIWLEQPNIRFAVLYNPIGMLASNQDLHRGLFTHQGELALNAFQDVRLSVAQTPQSKHLRLQVRNPGPPASLILRANSEEASVDMQTDAGRISVLVPEHWQGWITLDLDSLQQTNEWQLAVGSETMDIFINGLSFDNELQWPWMHRGKLTLTPLGEDQPIIVSFDPIGQLPPPLHSRQIQILNDDGASVLIRMD
jgi:hypothetical protein